MLNVSLHKLHIARQNHEGCLRRSVLICNMLRSIEDESEKDAAQDRYEQHQQQQQHLQQQQQQQRQLELDPYWSPPPHILPSLGDSEGDVQARPDPYHSDGSGSRFSNDMAAPSAATPAHSSSFGGDESVAVAVGGGGGLKGFDGEFRPTPFSSPAHQPEEEHESNTGTLSLIGSGEEVDDGKGINWGSVLSLSSQSGLDAVSFGSGDTWPSGSNVTTSMTVAATAPSEASSIVDDIGWKLSADDVLRAFSPPGGGGDSDYIAA